MVKTTFYLKTGKINSDGELSIYCKIKYRNTMTTMSSGKWITKKRWLLTNHLRNPLKIKTENTIRQYLDKIIREVDSACLYLSNAHDFITATDIKNKITGKVKGINEALCNEVIEMHNRDFDKKVTRRETFGRRVWDNQGQSENALMYLSELFNHSSMCLTRKYLGIRAQELQNIYLSLLYKVL